MPDTLDTLMNELEGHAAAPAPPRRSAVVLDADPAIAARPDPAARALPREREDQRSGRRNFGMPTLKLDYPARLGYHRCWINDDGQSVDVAKECGYEFVTEDQERLRSGASVDRTNRRGDDPGTHVRRLVGKQDGGAPLYAYLMEIREEWHQEDLEVIARHQRKVDQAIYGGSINPGTVGPQFYDAGINIQRK